MRKLGWGLALAATFLGTTSFAEVLVKRDALGRVLSVEVKESGKAARTSARVSESALLQSGKAGLETYASAFGLSDPEKTLEVKSTATDAVGMTHVRNGQLYHGVPVYGAELITHVGADGKLRSINGSVVENVSVNVTPTLSKEEATSKAISYWTAGYGIIPPEASEPKLWVVNPSFLNGEEPGESSLAYEVRLRNTEAGIEESYFVDAHTGELVYWLTHVRNATRREVYDCTNTSLGCVIDRYSAAHNYTFGRSEGQPERGVNPINGSRNTDLLYDRLEILRQYYLDTYGRDGPNGQGGIGNGSSIPRSTARAYLRTDDCPTGGGYNGSSFHLCATSKLVDIMAHEYSHGVPEVYALVYQGQPGALSEAFSCLNQEGFQRYLTGSNDWLYAQEEVTTLAASFASPTTPSNAGINPDRTYNSNFYCGTLIDNGGVHINAYVPMKAVYLASVGNTFNGCSVKAIGLDRVLDIFFHAYTRYFTSTTNLMGAYTYLVQACSDLYSAPICYQLDKALRAVEMNQPTRCSTTPRQTPQCDFCPTDAAKTDPGCNGCGTPDTDADGDGTPSCYDDCESDAEKVTPGRCGCGVADTDTDRDGTPDCEDGCVSDPKKTAPGLCGCGAPEVLVDADSDGSYGAGSCAPAVLDCNDADGTIYPGAPELCDGKNNDCDVESDETFDLGAGCEAGVGECVRTGVKVCESLTATTCDAVPGTPGTEICDALDNDCDGIPDDGLGLGDACSVGVGACLRSGQNICDASGGVTCSATAGEPATEICDAIDNDCDGTADDGFGLGDSCSVGVGACQRSGQNICDASGGVTCSATAGEPATEICDAIDNDCDGTADDGLGLGDACTVGVGACQRSGQKVCDASGGVACGATPGNPTAEICDGIDNDCDGSIDEGLTFDVDGDGYSTPNSCTGTKNDCNDGNATINPGAVEKCDTVDNDCDGSIDEGLTFDVDGDGYTAPASCGGSRNDCNDTRATIHPGATEICGNGIDEDCSGADLACAPTCVDSDGGMNPELAGAVTFGVKRYADACQSKAYLVEYYCQTPKLPSLKLVRCAGACTNNACKPVLGLLKKKAKKQLKALKNELAEEARQASGN